MAHDWQTDEPIGEYHDKHGNDMQDDALDEAWNMYEDYCQINNLEPSREGFEDWLKDDI